MLEYHSQPLELCDDSGKVVARVIPVLDTSDYEAWEPAFSEDDLKRQELANEKRFSTAEVLNFLEKL